MNWSAVAIDLVSPGYLVQTITLAFYLTYSQHAFKLGAATKLS